MTSLERKRKLKQKMKIHFWPKTEKAENDEIAHFWCGKPKQVSVGF